MQPVGGSVESVSIDGRIFPVAFDADGSRDLGGISNEIEANGDRSGRIIKTVKMPMVEGLTLSVDDARGDQEYLQGKANENGFFVFGMTLASGIVYQGEMQLTGDLKYSTQSATCAVTFTGQGELTAQS